jgi:uncharacterized membrane protein YdjX (TVP38/TMEM64 family)
MAEPEGPGGRRVWLAGGLVAGLLIAGLVLLWAGGVFELIGDRAQVRAWVEGYGPWGPVAIALLELAQTIAAPIPGQAIEFVSGLLYGPWWGALYAFAGIVAGSLINFGLSRRFGRPFAVRLAGKGAVARLDGLARSGGSLFFFLLWLLPFVPDDLVCLAAGLTPMPARRFFLLMVVGRLPGIVVSTWVGARSGEIGPAWWAVLFAALTVLALIVWRWGPGIQEEIIKRAARVSGGDEP